MNRHGQYLLAVALLLLGVTCTDIQPTAPPPAPPAVPPPPPVAGQEYEPNNSLATADTIALGDSIVGRVELPGDIDYFTVKLQAGTNVAITVDTLRSVTDWTWITSLLDSTGATLSRNDEYDDWLPGTRIWYTVPKTSRYFVRLGNEALWAGADPGATRGDYPYTLRVSAFRATPEHEPNNVAASANVVAVGDTISGLLAPGDSDYFALDLNAGTNLNLEVSSLNVTCNVVPEIRLLTSDGIELDREGSSPYNGSFNPRLEYAIPATGQYFVAFGVRFPPPTGQTPCYFLKIGTFTMIPPGPGNPVRTLASNIGNYNAIASSHLGETFLSTGICQTPERSPTDKVVRLEDDGSLTVLAEHLELTGALAVDPSGNVLAPGILATPDSDRYGVVWRISRTGERSAVAKMRYASCSIAVGSDGDIWVSEYGTGHTLRIDSLGNVKATFELGFYVDRMRFSPSGELYYQRIGELHKLVNGDTVVVSYDWSNAWTFDRDGYQYVSKGGYFGYNLSNKIVLLDPNRQPVLDPVAWLNYPIDLTFVRDHDGMPTKRLLVLKQATRAAGSTDVVELNPAGIRAPGP